MNLPIFNSNENKAEIIEVRPGLYIRREIDNMGWFDMGDYGLVVDALEQPEVEAEVFAAIKNTLVSLPISKVLNTHLHPDHVALNRAFEKAGAEIINARVCDMPANGLVFEGRDRQVTMLPMPGCHTHQDCVVWSEMDRILFVGDIFGWGLIPWMGNLTDKRCKIITDTYDVLLSFKPETVVPGHGPLCSANELKRWRDYFIWLNEEVVRLLRSGLDISEINSESLPPPDDMRQWWRFEEWKHADSVKKVVKAKARR